MRIVVVGSGFAGVEAVRKLEKLGLCERAECLWVTLAPKMVFLPLTPALAGQRYEPVDVEWSVESLAKRAGIELVDARVVAVEHNRIRLEGGEVLGYDYLVLAAGARPAFYGVPGAEEHSITACSVSETWWLGRRIREGRISSIVIVGAGFVGVEMAAELLSLSKSLGLELDITLVDVNSEPLEVLGNRRASRIVRRVLEGLGARLVMGQPVVRVSAEGVVLRDGSKIPADAVVWAAGFRGPGIDAPGESLTRQGFFRVDRYLRVRGMDGKVYAAGDTMHFEHGGNISLKMAREAIRSASRAVENIAAKITGKEEKPYKPLITSRRPLAGVCLGPGEGVVILGKRLALRTGLINWVHEKLREKYSKLLGMQRAPYYRRPMNQEHGEKPWRKKSRWSPVLAEA